MGLLNRFFHTSDLEQNINADSENALQIWNAYLESYSKKANFAKRDLTFESVQEIKKLIPEELIAVRFEENAEKELLKKLRKLSSNAIQKDGIIKFSAKEENIVSNLKEKITRDAKKIESITIIFGKLAELLEAEMQAIILLEKNPNAKEPLFYLKNMIITREFNLNTLFRHTLNREQFKEIENLTHKILSGERISDAEKTREELLVEKYISMMENKNSSNEMRSLAIAINEELQELADFDREAKEKSHDALKKLESLRNDNKIIMAIIKKNRPKISEQAVKAIIVAFMSDRVQLSL